METVAIVGVGLIGASFGLALRRSGFSGRIIGVSSPKAVAAGVEAGAISDAATLEQAAAMADLIYLSQPVDRILRSLDLLGPIVRPGCLITDAGSTKVQIFNRAADSCPKGTFLGGHPIAGKERRGAAEADGGLFENRPYVLTPSGEMTPQMEEFRGWLERFEARVVIMSAAEHDSVVSLTSHLPQLLSTALSLTLAKKDKLDLRQVYGPGLLDMTRLAMSSPELWQSILDTNRGEIVKALNEFSSHVAELTSTVEGGGNLDEAFTEARQFALALRKQVN